MTQRKLATEVYFDLNDGHKIPALGLGTVPLDDKFAVRDQVITAVSTGYHHIDTAWYYGTESYIGEALNELFKEGCKHGDLFITNKVWPSFHHNPEKSLDNSLSDLGIEYVNLFLQHWPICLAEYENGLPPAPKDENRNLKYDDHPADGKISLKLITQSKISS